MASSWVAHSDLEASLAWVSCTLVKFVGFAAPDRSESRPWLMGAFIGGLRCAWSAHAAPIARAAAAPFVCVER